MALLSFGAALVASKDEITWKAFKPRIAFAQEEAKMEKETADDNDIEEDMEMLFTTMAAENADELFNSQRNKIFYLYKGNKDERINVTQLIMMMQQNGLNLRPIIVNI